jgi:hypothetical protein
MIKGIYKNEAGQWVVDEVFPAVDANGNLSVSEIRTRPATDNEIDIVDDPVLIVPNLKQTDTDG